ncbi:Uncharacterised protein [Mycoplasmopsis californica]|uniref:NERD domain-containing protein n=1 Tax=Mycoplasmopsis equigenitalium TaxID=114883 RepID=A0ABY5J0Z5_9BACT|nr:hypothetical protein [Mycoplasmopsis equigenitalium]UUD36932.1 hypothetical protein NPA09_03470 [Mycoplasmopsis equigenitalium]VEU69773.1 Uncharacterised protein [Mycoplasmopsis californica]
MFTQPTILNIALWVLSGILVLIVLGVVIWRIVIHYKPSLDKKGNNKKQIGSINNDLNKFVKTIILKKDSHLIYNVLLKNKFAKLNYSLIPILIFHNNQAFLVSNLIRNTKNETIVLEEGTLKLINSKKQLEIEDVKIEWYEDIVKLLESKFELKQSQLTKIFLTLNNSEQATLNDYHIVSTYELVPFIEKIETEKISSFEIEKIKDKILSKNMIKLKVGK